MVKESKKPGIWQSVERFVKHESDSGTIHSRGLGTAPKIMEKRLNEEEIRRKINVIQTVAAQKSTMILIGDTYHTDSSEKKKKKNIG